MRVFVVLFFLLLPICVPAQQSSSSEPERARTLFEKLDAEAYRERVDAQKKLEALAGNHPEILEWLQAKDEPKSPEQKLRLSAILKKFPTRHFSFEKVVGAGRKSVAGVRGKAMQLDGTGKPLVLHPDTIEASPFTVRFWFKTSTDKYAQFLLSNYVPCSNDPRGFSLVFYGSELNGTPTLGLVVAGRNHIDIGGAKLADGKWHHLVLSVDAKSTSIYLDGKKLKQIDQAYRAAEEPLHVGRIRSRCNRQGDDGLVGTIDELSFFMKAWTPEQVRADKLRLDK